MQEFIDAIQAAIAQHTGLQANDIKIETPRDPKLGDLAFPCFPLAKALRSAPPKIAQDLGPKLAGELEGITVEPAGPRSCAILGGAVRETQIRLAEVELDLTDKNKEWEEYAG